MSLSVPSLPAQNPRVLATLAGTVDIIGPVGDKILKIA